MKTKIISQIALQSLALVFAFQTQASQVGELSGSPSVVQGKANYRIDMQLPPGVNDLVPNLSIDYRQGAGNGALGLGVSLSGLSTITRCTETLRDDGNQGGISFDHSDAFCLDGQRLQLVSGKHGIGGSVYRMAHAPQTKIVANGNGASAPLIWIVYSPDGFISSYGTRKYSKKTINGHGLEWKISRQVDRFKNAINYRYNHHNGRIYINQIDYADTILDFQYSDRDDKLNGYHFGYSETLGLKLDSIQMTKAGSLLRSVNLSYEPVDYGAISYTRLKAVQACDANYNCMPETTFEWESNPHAGEEPLQKTLFPIDEFKGFITGDIDRDGKADICYLNDGLYCGLSLGKGSFSSATKWSNDFMGEEWDETQNYSSLSFIDINDDSYLDVCAFNETGFFCALNDNGTKLNAGRYWSTNFTINDASRLLDVNNDRLIDVCKVDKAGISCANNTGAGLSSDYQLHNQGFTLEKTYNNIPVYRVNEPVNMPQSNFVDINGDGYVDICGVKLDGDYSCSLGKRSEGSLQFSSPESWATGIPVGIKHALSAPVLSEAEYDSDVKVLEQLQRTLSLSDLNNDGLPELCYRRDSQLVCHQNTGVGFGNAEARITLNSVHFEQTDYVGAVEASIMLTDKNGDGVSDFCYIAGEQLYCGFGNGRHFSQPTLITTIHADLEQIDQHISFASNFVRKVFGLKTTVHAMALSNIYGPFKQGVDTNDDGRPGDCYRSISGLTCLSYEVEPLAILKKVTSGFGSASTFQYLMSSSYSVFREEDATRSDLIGLSPTLKLVSRLHLDNGIGGQNTTAYSYVGYQAHPKYGILGFNEIRSTDLDNATTTTNKMSIRDDFTSYVSQRLVEYYYYTLSDTTFTYDEHPSLIPGKPWYLLSNIQSTSQDRRGKLLKHTTTDYQDYDKLGYPETVSVAIEDGNGGVFTETKTTIYAHNKLRWIIGKPVQISVTKSNGGEPQTRTTSFEYDDITGALNKQTIEPGHPLSLTQTFTYNSKGFRTSESSSSNESTRHSTTEYDTLGRVTKHTNALGHSVSTTYDSACGLPSSVTDANGLTTTFEYDSFCRETKQNFADGNWVEHVYEWSDGADAGFDTQGLVLGDRSIFMVTEQTSQGSSSTTYYDRLSRVVRKKSLNGAGKTVIVDIAYDRKGRKAGETIPYFEGYFPGDATYWVKTYYDYIHRPWKVTQPTESGGLLVAKTVYDGLKVTTDGPGNFTKSEETNGLGQTIRVVENDTSIIEYTYDAYGNLTQTNTNGQISTVSYDQLGNRTEINDPAMGSWHYAFNAWGDVISEEDANGNKINVSYDEIGRKIVENRPEGNSVWQYDAARKGVLDSASSSSSQRTYTYDELGRTATMTLSIDGKEYTTTYQYNEDGRLSRIHYPSGMNVDKDYDINGFIKRMSIPYSDIWDAQYIQIENALKETSERIIEIELEAYGLEKNAQELIGEAKRLQDAADILMENADDHEEAASELYASARSLFRTSKINADKATAYRNTARYYWNRFGSRVFDSYDVKNGYAYYKYDRCVDSNWKGCKRREHFTAQVPLWMVSTKYCSNGKFGYFCYHGPQNQINVTQVYNSWANHYQSLANTYRNKAKHAADQASTYTNLAQQADADAQQMLEQAQTNLDLARKETDLLSNLTSELDDLVEAEKELQEILDDRLSDETTEVVWVSTSRDQFGRVSGELFGNGYLTRRDIDRARGTVNRITTGIGDKYIRDIAYTYDERNNVLSKLSDIRDEDEFYQYDEFDRLTNWMHSDNKLVSTTERDYRYDVYGNLIHKTGIGDIAAKANGQLEGAYRYDANGNMLEGRGRLLTWNSFNKAQTINTNGSLVRYEYDSEKQRVKQTADGVTTYYIGPDYELEISANEDGESVKTMRHRFIADGQAVAEHVKIMIGEEKQIDRTGYFHRDALGSADLVTDQNGLIQVERSYTPFGELLAVAQLQSKPLFLNEDLRGFTGHENVGNGNLSLINMNARLYDPVLGRFLSADSLVPHPDMSQSYNRYAYVYNNPMKYNDPTGHFVNFVIGAVIAVFAMTFENPTIQMIGMVVGAYFMGPLTFGADSVVLSGATVSFTTNFIATGDLASAAQAGVIGGISAAATWQVGHGFGKDWNLAGQALGHGVSQGSFTAIRGDSFKQGFISGVIGKLGGKLVHENLSDVHATVEVAGIIVVSGIAAEASGANSNDAILRSAMSVVTVYLFNDTARAWETRAEDEFSSAKFKDGLNSVSGAADKVATACFVVGAFTCAAPASAVSLGSSAMAVSIDIVDGDGIKEATAAGVVNTVGTNYLTDKTIEVLPPKYELPITLGSEAYGKISGFMFDEAAGNMGEK
ncbi:type IV secretion protein Rhs [Enterovibrio makurazakiensis]|uniref:RHS repeat-associated core domain-containing protein n=1 Tax=Enterovibrio makurazakiensis TaxID=2910232 RepID=UPI003D22F397